MYIHTSFYFQMEWGISVFVGSSKQPGWFKSQLSSVSLANNIDQYLNL